VTAATPTEAAAGTAAEGTAPPGTPAEGTAPAGTPAEGTPAEGTPAEGAGAGVPERRRRGRPRSRRAEEAITEATIDLIVRHGVCGLSIEGVAQRAGVAKTTIYRRWASKEELALDVLARMHGPAPDLPPGGSVRDDLVFLLLAARSNHEGTTRWSAVLRRLAGEVDTYPEESRAFMARAIAPRRLRTLEVLRRGIQEGVVRADADLDLAAEALIAPVLLGALLPLRHQLGPDRVTALVDLVLAGLAPAPAPG